MNRQEIARLALQETQRHSFEKVSMQSLADKFGVKKASFYYHFPSKQALAVAVVKEALQLLKDYFARFKNRPATIQLDAYVRVFSKHMHPIENLCPGAGFVATWPNQSDAVKQAVVALYQTHINHLTEVIDTGKMQGTFAVSQDSKCLAQSIFCILQGSLLAARVTASTDVFNSVRASIHTLIGETNQ